MRAEEDDLAGPLAAWNLPDDVGGLGVRIVVTGQRETDADRLLLLDEPLEELRVGHRQGGRGNLRDSRLVFGAARVRRPVVIRSDRADQDADGAELCGSRRHRGIGRRPRNRSRSRRPCVPFSCRRTRSCRGRSRPELPARRASGARRSRLRFRRPGVGDASAERRQDELLGNRRRDLSGLDAAFPDVRNGLFGAHVRKSPAPSASRAPTTRRPRRRAIPSVAVRPGRSVPEPNAPPASPANAFSRSASAVLRMSGASTGACGSSAAGIARPSVRLRSNRFTGPPIARDPTNRRDGPTPAKRNRISGSMATEKTGVDASEELAGRIRRERELRGRTTLALSIESGVGR